MRKSGGLITLLCLFILIFIGCSHTEKKVDTENNSSSGFGIYLVKGKNPIEALTFGRFVNETYIDGKKVDTKQMVITK